MQQATREIMRAADMVAKPRIQLHPHTAQDSSMLLDGPSAVGLNQHDTCTLYMPCRSQFPMWHASCALLMLLGQNVFKMYHKIKEDAKK